jgi:hypothetical protein
MWSPSLHPMPLPTPSENAESTLPPAHRSLTTPEPLTQPSHQVSIPCAVEPSTIASTSDAPSPESSLAHISFSRPLDSRTPPPRLSLTGVSPELLQEPLVTPQVLPQVTPSTSTLDVSPEPPVSSRGRRLRKANVLSLNMCTCGVTITDSEINTGQNIMKCRVAGCETVWVRSPCVL